MRSKRPYWVAALARGIVALIWGSAIFFVPEMAKSLLLLPIAVETAILGLAFYGVVDSSIVLLTSYAVPSRMSRIALRIQGFTGFIIGLVLLSAIYSQVQLQWFLYFATVQTLATAVAEFVVARHASSHAISIWSYSAALIALLCGVSYWFIAMRYGAYLTTQAMTELIFGYLIAFGASQCLNASRMLYRHSSAPTITQRNVARQAV